MTTYQWISIMVIICLIFMATTTVFGSVLGSLFGALIVGSIVAYGANQPGGTGWK